MQFAYILQTHCQMHKFDTARLTPPDLVVFALSRQTVE